jgi:hypothetical protein
MRGNTLPGRALIVAALVLSLVLAGCDLLSNKPEIDLEKAMDEAIAYANAARLTVTVAVPDGWGFSPQQGTNRAGDTRRGFPFDVEFTPAPAYAFLEWRAYRTSVLPADWRNDPGTALHGVEELEEGAVSIAAAGENRTGVTIAIGEPVTLIPWCRDEPRIIRTDPPLDVQGGYYRPAKTITIYFAAPLNESSAQSFGTDYIVITARNIESDGSVGDTSFNVCGMEVEGARKWFKDPVYDNNLRTITIEPEETSSPEENVEITVELGTGIQSSLSTNGMSKAVSFSYRTRSASASFIDTWTAAYNPEANAITVTYTDSEETGEKRGIRYRVNGGAVAGIEKEPGEKKFIINNVPRLDTGGVRAGRPVGNRAAYEIYLDMYTNNEVTRTEGPIKIWNIPGMAAANDDRITVITAEAELAAVSGSGKYALANDITLTGTWTPIGNFTTPFKGKFYGNGHTVTIGSGFSFADIVHTGIFGYTDDNAVIRDLTVAYNADAAAGSKAAHIGGIVGSAGGSTTIRNCIVSGASGVILSKTGASAAACLGGIAGYMEPEAAIVNASSSLNVSLVSTGGVEAWAGGAVGYIAGGGDGSVTNIEDVSVSGNVSLDKTGDNPMSLGGVVGAGENSGWIKNVSFAGTVSASRDSTGTGISRIGGIAGYAMRTSFDNCFFTGTVKTPIDGGRFEPSSESDTSGDETRIGGIIGHYTTDGTSTTEASPKMTNSNSSGTFFITHSGAATLSLGGVVGLLNASGNELVTIKNCSYEQGNIILERDSLGLRYYDQVGGFSGKVDLGKIESCASLAGLIMVIGRSSGYAGSLWVGGFVSEIRQESDITNCYSTSPVEAYDYSSTDPMTRDAFRGMMVGGFAALVQTGGIVKNCYATGDVTAYAANQRLAAGGFAGRADKYDQSSVKNTIQYCYATGDVSATSDRASGNEKDFDVGGLVGKPEGTEILDCYALGNVFAEACSGPIPVCAGGIAGYLGYDTNKTATTTPTVPGAIQRCFATGSVTARSAASGPVYAGGIAGYAAQSVSTLETTIANNVARGILILAESGDTVNRKAGRVYGASVGSGANTYSDIGDNYGLVIMKTGTGGYYNGTGSFPVAADHTGPDGVDVANNTSLTAPGGIKTEGFWETTLGFSAIVWNFSDVAYRGYPVLK